MPPTSATFGELLRQYRLAAGLTQEGLAERAGLSEHGIQKLERGATHPYRETAQRLELALQLVRTARPPSAWSWRSSSSPMSRPVSERLYGLCAATNPRPRSPPVARASTTCRFQPPGLSPEQVKSSVSCNACTRRAC